MTMTTEAPKIGDNLPQREAATIAIAAQIVERLKADYAALEDAVVALLDRARKLPADVESEEDLGAFASVARDLRDASARAEAIRVAEKEPYLRGGQAVDAHFQAARARLDKALVIVTRRADEYQQRKLAIERRKREEEEMAARRAAEEARLAAERARKAQNIVDRKMEATLAQARAEQAEQAAQAKAAELVRSRFDTGAMVTMRQVPHVEVTDYALLPLDVLRPYIDRPALLRAVKAWARLTAHKEQMAGAVIELRDDTVIR